MAVLNPDHLFEQANKLVTIQAGPPRQVDIRRAISAAYYATFHAAITAAADQFIGVTNRDTSRYGLVYRSVSHAWLRDLCKEVQKPTLSNKFKPHLRVTDLGLTLRRLPQLSLNFRKNATPLITM